MITKKQRKLKRHTTIRRLCHQALAATLITGSLMGTGLLGNKVVYGDMKSDAKKVLATLQKGNHKQELKKVLRTIGDDSLLLLWLLVSGDSNLDESNKSFDYLSIWNTGSRVGKVISPTEYFKQESKNTENRQAVYSEFKQRVEERSKKAKEATEALNQKAQLEATVKNINEELEKTREGFKVVSENSNKLEKQLMAEKIKTRTAEETAKQAKTDKEKAEAEAKKAKEEAKTAEGKVKQAETEKRNAE
ncbi:TPA: cell surface protein, partial [Streptococcus equi subsp. equi]|nr:cell surface protein [Streptococcus equi subsp. equi]HEK9117894.1 cell surface protein [Streptococcus equi subsp. equi]HEK9128781.1 cell surface protein [Streptococcus equi subsp. equi]HEK9132614.1 cell surface protein [Streptococcus equi subsp. equi]HEK9136556.1 cell surface protein [Streptococcus equi subsp. equi]